MKPYGAIPSGYSAANGELVIGGRSISALIAQAGDTPLFVYDFGLVRQRIAALRQALPREVALHYAVKANPFPALVRAIIPLVDGIDLASGGEMALALAQGANAHHVSFAGPGKRDRELSAAIQARVTLNVESEGEAHRALAIGMSLGVTPRLAVRVNPDFDMRGSGMKMGGGAKPFGVDAARVPALVEAIINGGADWRGFHVYSGSQALDAASVIETQSQTIMLTASLAERIGHTPPHVNLGGGFGIPYFANEHPLDLVQVGEGLGVALGSRPDILKDTQFCIELGRYLVGEAGVYLTRVVDRKESHGEVFLVTDGGMHHQLAASGNFGTVVRRNYPIAVANRFREDAEEQVSVVGCLCTPLDRLADQVMLPRADVGDIIAIFMAGAYGASASPTAFLGHPSPIELLVNDEL
jgi:diaminopimelate decarboxylase